MDPINTLLHSMSITVGDKFACAFQVYTGQNKYEKVTGTVDEILLAGGQIGIKGTLPTEYWYISIETYFRSNILLKRVDVPEPIGPY
jgi:hypothetical protein